MLLVSGVVDLVSIDYMPLFLPSLLLLTGLFIGFVNDPHSVFDTHHLHLQPKKLVIIVKKYITTFGFTGDLLMALLVQDRP